ncbi:MAG: hypothetical protein B9S33_07515 [Pedosphaera sp. Tous-C6FEB]|nr:MAG: hypothetical protein B9S33_07515 [Pedosphaera sp. Tous-C6FEB]
MLALCVAMNEPFDPRPQETANRLRLVVLLPVLITVVGVVLIAAKLAGQFNRIEEPPARDYPPNPPRGESTPGRLLPTMAGHAIPLVQSNTFPVTNVLVGAPASAALRTPTPTNAPAASVARLPVTVAAPPNAPIVTHGPASALGELPTGGIVGRVFLRGTRPAAQALPLDPSCGKLHPSSRPQTRLYVVGTNGELADVFIGLKGLPPGQWNPPSVPIEIRQRGCEYLPYISAAQVGQTIRVFNDDPLMHNVHPTPVSEGNREQNRAQLNASSPPLDHSFPEPEPFLRFKCDVHPWMFAYVTVVAHPFFAVSAADGLFTLPEPPPGNYTLQIRHRRAGEKLVPVTVRPGKRLLATVTLDLADPLKHEVVVTEE